MTLSWTIHSPAGTQRKAINQPRSVSVSSIDTPTLSQSARQAPPTISDESSNLMTRFPKSYDHLSLTQSVDEPGEHAIFAQSLISSQTNRGKRGREGRFRRDVSPMEDDEDFVAGRGEKVANFRSRFRDDSLVSLPDSREDPDGQSDISSLSPEALTIRRESTPDTPVEAGDTPSVCSLTPPPSTPLTANGNSFKPTITPLMIQSALTALQQIQNKDTPISTGGTDEGGHSPIFPEEVTTALTAWINQQHSSSRQRSANSSELQTPLLSPPPSTPQKAESESDSHSAIINLEGPGAWGSVRQGISASDLIAALSSLIAQDAMDATSGESSGVCSVPACTPKEGFSEWLRLGIHPDEVIHALSALTISRGDQEGEGEEGPEITRPSQLVTTYEDFPPSVVVSDADNESGLGEDREREREGGRREEEEGEGEKKEKEREGERRSSLHESRQTSDERYKGQQKVAEEDSNQVQTAAGGKQPEGAEKGEEFEGESVDQEQSELSVTPVGDMTGLTASSEEALGIHLLNDLSFFPDPLATAVSGINERDVPSNVVTTSAATSETNERDSPSINSTPPASASGNNERGSPSINSTPPAAASGNNERGSLSINSAPPAAASGNNEKGSPSINSTPPAAASGNNERGSPSSNEATTHQEANLLLANDHGPSFERPSSPMESVLYSDARD